jgi:hypothetical protein
VLVTTLDQRLAKLSDVPEPARAKAVSRAARIVEEKIRPAYRRVQAFMAEIHPRTNVAGISRLPGGLRRLPAALPTSPAPPLTAAQIHEIGLREVARIEGEMDRTCVARLYEGSDRGAHEEAGRQLPAETARRSAPRAPAEVRGDGGGRRAAQQCHLQPEAARAGRGAPRAAADGSLGRRPLFAAGAGRQPSRRLLGADARPEAST